MDIVLKYDSSVGNAPTGFKTALTDAATALDNLIVNPITVTIDVGYGEVDGSFLGNGVLGEADDNSDNLDYATVKAHLAAADPTAVLPTLNGNTQIQVGYAEEQAWGVTPSGSIDGYVRFGEQSGGQNGGSVYDYGTTAVAGEYYFIGIAEHELTHALGRVSSIGEGYGTPMSVLDLFQYSSTGVLAPINYRTESSYFSTNGGVTPLATFDDTSDPADWALGTGYDSFNAYSDPGVINPITSVDMEELNALGFDINAGAEQVACFAAGTLIRTQRGDVAVEALRPNDDLAITADGRAAKIVWTGWRTLSPPRHPRPHDVNPVRVRRDAFAPGKPARDLLLSPDHAVSLDGVLMPIRYLLNGRTIAQEPADSVTYWHVELDRHDVLLAEGLPAESFLDTGNRAAFANGGAIVQMAPDFARRVWDADGCAPLVLAGPARDRAHRRLLRRAASLGWTTTDDPAIRLSADRQPLAATVADRRWSLHLPAGVDRVRIGSRSFVPAEADAAASDHRRLGVAIGKLWLDGREVSLDSPGFASGWHAPESAWRWSDGEATLAIAGCRHLAFTLEITGDYPVPPVEQAARPRRRQLVAAL